MHRSQIFLLSVTAYILGVFIRSFWDFPAIIMAMPACLAVAIFCTFYREQKAMILSLLLIMLFFGVWRTDSALGRFANIEKSGTVFSGKAVVIKEPDKKDNYQNLVLRAEDENKFLVREDVNSDVRYGDQFMVSCRLEVAENKKKEFDYRMFLAKDGINHLCQDAEMEKTGSDKASRYYGVILRMKNKLQKTVEETLSYPYSALGSGLLFGGSSQLPDNLKNDFSLTGLTHIVAVSGFNVTIIAQYLIILGIAIGLWRKQAFWFAISGIFLFIAMIGFPSSAVRAGVMGSLLLWAMKKGRLADSWNAITLAAAIMLVVNPLLLRWDTGFQLSFLATIGIVGFSPLWEKINQEKIPGHGIWEIIFLTLAAQVFVVPIIAYQFHTFSVISLLANLLVLPIVPFLMLLVFLAALIGSIWPPSGSAFFWLSFFLLKYVIETTRFLSRLSFSSVEISQVPIFLIVIHYSFFGWLIWRLRRGNVAEGKLMRLKNSNQG